MHKPVVRVVKVGGSLLALPKLGERLEKWLAGQTPGHTILVVGGGPLADAVREADRLHGFGDEAAHWMCIDVMGVTARIVDRILKGAEHVATMADLKDRLSQAGVTVFDVKQFLREVEPAVPGTRLAPAWEVTSDSIAARLAMVVGAEELVLLKSRMPTPGATLGDLAAAGYVDRFMLRLAAELPPIRFVDLREEGRGLPS